MFTESDADHNLSVEHASEAFEDRMTSSNFPRFNIPKVFRFFIRLIIRSGYLEHKNFHFAFETGFINSNFSKQMTAN